MASIYMRFDNKDILNSGLRLEDGTVEYTTSTKKGWLGMRRAPTEVRISAGLCGSIDWEGRTFTIDGVQRPWSALKTHVTRTKSEWAWSETRYIVRTPAEELEWIARPTLGWVDVARFETWDKNTPTISLSSELRDETEKIFMLLVLIYSRGILSYE
ncbi:hypothetical protein FB451DRAFT_1277423 [Mycena latifolia]|nr:hypothetical protein FB451DRAFT_1277423 [Mycena latifolia]